MYFEEIKLISGHSLIMGHCPEKVTNDQLLLRSEDTKSRFAEVARLGFFDSYAPQAAFSPEITADDFVPKAEDYIQPVFRALSEVIVHRSWNPVDFAKNGVLKKSTKLLEGQSIYPNHDALVGNELGVIYESFWEKSYTTEDKHLIPAGINARLKIDAKSNPRIARSLTMTPPSIHSSSVTVNFGWEQSHNLSQDEFYMKLGTFDKDGTMIRKIATEIHRYNEMSFVTHGADPYAQLITPTGVITNPNYAERSQNSEQSKKKVFYFDFKDALPDNYFDVVKNTAEPPKENPTIPEVPNNNEIPPTTESKNQNGMNRTQMVALAAILALSYDAAATDEQLSALITAEVTKLKNNSSAETPEVVALKKYKTDRVVALRGEVLANYNKLMGDKAAEAVKNSITATEDEAVLNIFNDQYKAQLEEKYPLTCKKCNSTDISRGSATPPAKDDAGDVTPVGEFDGESFMRDYQRKTSIKMPGFNPAPTK